MVTDEWTATSGALVTGQVVGWGVTETQITSPVLRVVDLEIAECHEELEENSKIAGKYCAFNTANNQTTCTGDDGGGFVINYKNSKLLIGIVSTAALPNATKTGEPIENRPKCPATPSIFDYFKPHVKLLDRAREYLEVRFVKI